MARALTKERAVPHGGPLAAENAAVSSWRTLYRAAGMAALITALLIPIQIAVFMGYPFPETVRGWFRLLQENPFAGLIDLDLLLVVDNILLVVVAIAVYVALRPVNASITTMATGLWLVAIRVPAGASR